VEWAANPQGKGWTARSGHSVTEVGNLVVVFGGSSAALEVKRKATVALLQAFPEEAQAMKFLFQKPAVCVSILAKSSLFVHPIACRSIPT
jgi:uncharacterized protein (DUF1330 family)